MKSLSKFETNTVKSEIIKGIAFEEPVDVDIENPNGKQFNFDFIKVEDSQVLLTESNYIKVEDSQVEILSVESKEESKGKIYLVTEIKEDDTKIEIQSVKNLDDETEIIKNDSYQSFVN